MWARVLWVGIAVSFLGCSGGGANGSNPPPTSPPPNAPGVAALSWNAVRANSDGTTLTDLAGYRLYVGTAPGVYAAPVVLGNVTSHRLQGLAAGTYYFAVSAFDTAGNESLLSAEVSKVVQ